MTEALTLTRYDGETIAYHLQPPSASMRQKTAVIWLGGFKSDMSGTKATTLHQWAKSVGRGFVRFDYFGHGESSGRFVDGTISRWTDDSLSIMDHVAEGPQILVGSSMGGWLSLLAAIRRPERVRGLVLAAPAVDFTERLIWEKLPEHIKLRLKKGGIFEQPSMYDDHPYPITMNLVLDGRSHLLLGDSIPVNCPVRILHGMCDDDVPWSLSEELVDKLETEDAILTFIKSADHRLSEPDHLHRLVEIVDELCRTVEGEDRLDQSAS